MANKTSSLFLVLDLHSHFDLLCLFIEWVLCTMITASYLSTTHFLYAALSWLSFKSFPSLFIVWKLIRLIIRIQWGEASRKSIRSYTEDWTAIDLKLTFISLPRLLYWHIEIVEYMESYLALRFIVNCRGEETSAHQSKAYLISLTNSLTFTKTMEYNTKYQNFTCFMG